MNDSQDSALKLFVKRLVSHSNLTDVEHEALLSLTGQCKRVAAHVDFVRLDEQVSHASLVVDGLVGRFGQTRNGIRQITCLYIPGDMADLPSVVAPRSGWALGALAATTIMQIPHSDLQSLATKHPRVAEAFWRDCVVDGSIFSEWVVNVGRRSALSRLAHVFCEMAVRCEETGSGDRTTFPLPITQADLGDATGLTAVHVNRTLKDLRTRGIVELRSGVVTIHDWKKLVFVGDFGPAFLNCSSAVTSGTKAR